MSAAIAARVLVIDDEPNICEAVKKGLERVGYSVDTAAGGQAAMKRLARDGVDLVLCDIKLPDIDGMRLLDRIRESHPATVVIMITGYASIESAVAAIKHGAADYLPKPFGPEQLRHTVAKALAQRRLAEENAYLKGELRHAFGEAVLVGHSASMRRLFSLAQTVAAADSSVLILGESGTGKEVVARYIHAESTRKEGPVVTINCAAIPAELLESELFGHRRGAFTGATYDRRGSFELAHGGTLFLDEIGEMAIGMQAKILRALEEHQIKRVGSEESTPVNVRIIAATNRDLEQEVRAGRFREDLYWRLNVVQLMVPPLRDRREDIAPLAHHFLAFYAHELKKPVPGFSAEALEALNTHDWPGNVRELRNAVERAVIFIPPGKPIGLSSLPPNLRHDPAESPALAGAEPRTALKAQGRTGPGYAGPPSAGLRTLQEVELEHMRCVLEACGGNRIRAAEILGISAVTLWRKLGRVSDDT